MIFERIRAHEANEGHLFAKVETKGTSFISVLKHRNAKWRRCCCGTIRK